MTTEQKQTAEDGFVTVATTEIGTIGYKNLGGGKFLVRGKPAEDLVVLGAEELILEAEGFTGLVSTLVDGFVAFGEQGDLLAPHPEAPEWAQALVRGASGTEVIAMALLFADGKKEEVAWRAYEAAAEKEDLLTPPFSFCGHCPKWKGCAAMVASIEAVMAREAEEALAEAHVQAMAEADAARAEVREALREAEESEHEGDPLYMDGDDIHLEPREE